MRDRFGVRGRLPGEDCMTTRNCHCRRRLSPEVRRSEDLLGPARGLSLRKRELFPCSGADRHTAEQAWLRQKPTWDSVSWPAQKQQPLCLRRPVFRMLLREPSGRQDRSGVLWSSLRASRRTVPARRLCRSREAINGVCSRPYRENCWVPRRLS